MNDLILFDGYCIMCSRIVRFVIDRDPRGRYRFAPLDSEIGKAYAAYAPSKRTARRRSPHGIGAIDSRPAAEADARSGPSESGSFMLVRGGSVYVKSRAALEVLRKLSGAWPLLYAFVLVPAPLRDRVYEFIARNRYRWFGVNKSCMLPSPDMADRFVLDEAGGKSDA